MGVHASTLLSTSALEQRRQELSLLEPALRAGSGPLRNSALLTTLLAHAGAPLGREPQSAVALRPQRRSSAALLQAQGMYPVPNPNEPLASSAALNEAASAHLRRSLFGALPPPSPAAASSSAAGRACRQSRPEIACKPSS